METAEYMPGQFWGDLPWSDEWRKGWRTGAGWRCDDARHARGALLDVSDALFQVLADYTGTDQRAAVKLKLAGEAEGLTPYLSDEARDGSWGTGSYRPGGDHHFGGHRDPDRDPLGRTRPGNPDLVDDGPYGGPTDDYSLPPADGLDDALWKQMSKHGDFLHMLEKEARAEGIDVGKFYTNYLLPGLHTRPVKIEQYADEVLVAHAAYKDIVDVLDENNRDLPQDWTGDGGDAFGDYMYAMQKYLEDCATEAETLGKTAKEAADVIRKLRDGYAGAIKEYAPTLREKYAEYIDWRKGTYNVIIGALTLDFEKAIGGLFTALSAFHGNIDHKRMAAWEISGAITMAGADRHDVDVPDLGKKARRPEPVPTDEDPSWRDKGKW
ncbi:MAG: WXG100 family type VII secretion target [Micromonosporaceae bacterium]